jgi:rubredoxin
MGYTLDYFVASLKCPVCGVISEADESTNMQTHIRKNPELAYLGIGHPLEIEPKYMKRCGYLTIQPSQPGQEIRILETWECPSCGAPYNWAEVVVLNGVIKEIVAVEINRTVFEQAHYISDECVSIAMDLTDRTYTDIIQDDLVEILRERL